ncbi:methyltransferase-like protein 12, mitochondrial [Platysternon megacephalum]|uniref:Methyltransferase-like protein 12, mitochondrial n=1 Tax=Platysternon megacephalum TaxID=55544 RepID=A0A4D9DRN8_9SAUR|nr:methyltransferase-like protein 12, mitochondrial [Platysternon megacephalum]
MFIYKWPADKENDTGIVSQHSMCDMEGGGISSYAENPPAAGKSLKQCLDQAVSDVPKERHPLTPLYLGATAGMRLLNKGAAQAATAEYGWIGQWVRPKKPTLGAMDLGGASTQITFETQDPIEDPQNGVTLRLYGQTYKVYTHSFLCYGRDQILRRMLSKVMKVRRPGSAPAGSSRWPAGLSSQHSSPSLLNHQPPAPCSQPGCYTQGSRFRSPALPLCPSREIEGCASELLLSHLLSPRHQAFSAFFYTVDFIQTVMKRRVASPDDLNTAAEAICSASWTELLQKAPKQEKWLPDYCAVANFVYLLITKGYRFNESSFPNIAFQKKAGDTSIGWALGYMLNLTNMIPADKVGFRKGVNYSSWVVLVLLFVAVILMALGTAWLLWFCPASSTAPCRTGAEEAERHGSLELM